MSGVTSSTASTWRSTDTASAASGSFSIHQAVSLSWSADFSCGGRARMRTTRPRTVLLRPSAYWSNACCDCGGGCVSAHQKPRVIQMAASGMRASRSEYFSVAIVSSRRADAAVRRITGGCQLRASTMPREKQNAAASRVARRNWRASIAAAALGHSAGFGFPFSPDFEEPTSYDNHPSRWRDLLLYCCRIATVSRWKVWGKRSIMCSSASL